MPQKKDGIEFVAQKMHGAQIGIICVLQGWEEIEAQKKLTTEILQESVTESSLSAEEQYSR